MKKILGFACFFIAVGMVVSLFLSNWFWFFVVVVGLLLVGYNLFCC